MTQARPKMGWRPRNKAQGNDEAQDEYAEPAASKLYDRLGSLAPHISIIIT